jgi:hypothetical protein
MANSQERAQVMLHILNVLVLDDTLAQTLAAHSIRTPRQLLTLGRAGLKELYRQQVVTFGDYNALRSFQGWMTLYMNMDGRSGRPSALPKTPQEWEAEFTTDSYDEFIDSDWLALQSAGSTRDIPQVAGNGPGPNEGGSQAGNSYQGSNRPPSVVIQDDDSQAESQPAASISDNSSISSNGVTTQGAKAKTPTNQTKSNGRKSKPLFKVSLSDFPEFNGKHNEWRNFKKEARATMQLLGLGDLLTVYTKSEVQAHKDARKIDSDYNQRVKDFHAILSKKLTKGSATAKIEAHSDHEVKTGH